MVKSIGIIGAGPGGLAALYEFLHTNKDGTSSVGSTTAEPAFEHIVAFERLKGPGGVWSEPSASKDPDAPVNIDKVDYSLPQEITDTTIKDIHDGYTFSSPLIEDRQVSDIPQWKNSATFRSLFTNIPSNLTRFSYIPQKEEYNDKSRALYPFLSLDEQVGRLQEFVDREGLHQYIRYSSQVQRVYKRGDKWVLEVHDTSEKGKSKWYKEEFDAVVVAWGHYSVPYFPKVDGFAEFVKKHPNVVSHAKTYRQSKDFSGHDVLVVGGSVSTVNVVENIFPVAKSLDISRGGRHPWFQFISVCLDDSRFDQKPYIKEYLPETGQVVFADGTKKKYSKIVLTTGYHNHFPGLEEYLPTTNPGSKSSVEGLYYHTFSIKDNTLGVTGILTTPAKFASIEASAAALAGVWSGAKTLPSVQAQTAWLDKLREANPLHNLLHHTQIEQLFAEMKELWPKGRESPLRDEKNFVQDIDYGYHKLVRLFYERVGLPQ